MNLRWFRRNLKIWIFPLVLFIAGFFSLYFWNEVEMNKPGGIRDTEYWEQATAASLTIADMLSLSGYLDHRLAEMVADSPQNVEAVVVFGFMRYLLKSSDPSRKITDLKYALAVYKKQSLLDASAGFKWWISVHSFFNEFFNRGIVKKNLVSESEKRLEKIKKLQKAENEGDLKSVHAVYDEMTKSEMFSEFKPALLLRKAYYFYERDPEESKKCISLLKKAKLNSTNQVAFDYLRKKISKKFKINGSSTSGDKQVVRLLKAGHFKQALQVIAAEGDLNFSSRNEEIQSLFGDALKQSLKPKNSVLAKYFDALNDPANDAVKVAEQLVKLSQDDSAVALGALLHYQAWCLAYFDAHNYHRMSLYAEILKTRDPLSPYSQLESMRGLFRYASTTYSEAEIQQVWERKPYLFEMSRGKDKWDGFKSGRQRTSQTFVHEGVVYVVNYGVSGEAKKLQKLNAGEATLGKAKEKTGKPEKMGWLDKIFFGQMMKFVPLGIRTFKEQLGVRKQTTEQGTIFERFYTQEEFETIVIDKMKSAIGKNITNIRAQIDESGFTIGALVDLRVIQPALFSATGRLQSLSETGRLILELDHVKLGKIQLPEWLLKSVEKSFNAISKQGDASPIDILSMSYQSGGILMKCIKNGNKK